MELGEVKLGRVGAGGRASPGRRTAETGEESVGEVEGRRRKRPARGWRRRPHWERTGRGLKEEEKGGVEGRGGDEGGRRWSVRGRGGGLRGEPREERRRSRSDPKAIALLRYSVLD
ncbi:uncharacterized protein A4U43_C07F16910 [Asparagus officinalis]|uniref:Uncharacterized protein n=1 Tax=Asparagus officinalis TaxID=4686 RepID=A0A5P1ECK3_ASPOF|nr:uncharacterized protein A4U43_C07F16910 [Asparagus officinalis]